MFAMHQRPDIVDGKRQGIPEGEPPKIDSSGPSIAGSIHACKHTKVKRAGAWDGACMYRYKHSQERVCVRAIVCTRTCECVCACVHACVLAQERARACACHTNMNRKSEMKMSHIQSDTRFALGSRIGSCGCVHLLRGFVVGGSGRG